MRFENLMEVKISVLVIWVVRTKDGDSMFLRIVGMSLQVHTASQPRRPTSTEADMLVAADRRVEWSEGPRQMLALLL
jgi:hypothetical protein